VTRPIIVLRPEPGNAATMQRAGEKGLTAIALPLFAVVAIDWRAPDAADHDALILTSANALRWGGAQLDGLRGLPVFAVGQATAAAARAAGFEVSATGRGDANALLAIAEAQGIRRALHLGGRESTIAAGGTVARSIAVYASDPCVVPAGALRALIDATALLHSARAAQRLAALVDVAGFPRGRIAIAALSAAVAAAAGPGWQATAIAPTPDDDAVLSVAATI